MLVNGISIYKAVSKKQFGIKLDGRIIRMTMKIRDRNDFDESGKNNFSSCRRPFSFFEEREG